MEIRVNGQDLVGFTEAYVSRHFLDVSGHFSFSTSPKDLANNGFPIKVQQQCEIIVEGQTFLNGFIEKVNISSTANDVTINVMGRDRTSDLVDSTVDFNILGRGEFTGNVTLKKVCEDVIANLGITDIAVIDKVNPKILSEGDFVAPFTGEGAFDFLQKYSKKRQVLLVTDGNGNLLITQAVDGINNPVSLPTNIINVFDGDSNNVISSRYFRDTSKEFFSYKGYSQMAATTINMSTDPGGAGSIVNPNFMSSQSATVNNSEIRNSRSLVFITDTPVDNETMPQRCAWELNYRRSQGEAYKCVVQGHTFNDEEIWPLNTLVKVFDDYADINGANMLIDNLTFYESVSGGQTTELNLVNNLSYGLQVEENYRQALSESIGDAYFTRSPGI